MTEEEKKEKKELNYYYRNHEKCKAYARKYAKANYQKYRENILKRKHLKRVENRKPEKVVKVEKKKPKKVVIHINTWQKIPLIVASNTTPEEKLAAIVHLL